MLRLPSKNPPVAEILPPVKLSREEIFQTPKFWEVSSPRFGTIPSSIVFDQRFTVELPSPARSPAQLVDIVAGVLQYCMPPGMPYRVPRTLFEKWEKRSITKRISQYFHETHKYDLPAKVKESLGEVLAPFIKGSQTIRYDFNRTLDWRDGNYGDHDSCYFKRSFRCHGCVPTLLAAGCFAMRFYNQRGKGNGRVLLLPWENGLIAFNWTNAIPDFQKILGDLLDFKWKRILAKNTGTAQNWIFFESAAIGAPPKTTWPDKIAVPLELPPGIPVMPPLAPD